MSAVTGRNSPSQLTLKESGSSPITPLSPRVVCRKYFLPTPHGLCCKKIQNICQFWSNWPENVHRKEGTISCVQTSACWSTTRGRNSGLRPIYHVVFNWIAPLQRHNTVKAYWITWQNNIAQSHIVKKCQLLACHTCFLKAQYRVAC